jgi:SAM-dependent methyltransferase
MTDIAMEQRARARATWGAGNWDEVSKLLPPVGQVVLDLAAVGPGLDVLDVGTGSGGTVAIPAAQRGARVVGVDVTPENFPAALRRAAEAGVDVDWIEGDAAALPLPDDRFDRVLSTFGHAFAPDQESAGRELVRVCRPGGTIIATMWTPEGYFGDMFKLVGGHMPPPPPGFQPPVLWGTETRWRELVEPLGVELEFRREMLVYETEDDPEMFYSKYERDFGPLVVARGVLGDGFAALQSDLRAQLAGANTHPGGGVRFEAEYLVAVGRV